MTFRPLWGVREYEGILPLHLLQKPYLLGENGV